MGDFQYQSRTRLIFGNDSIDRLGDIARETGGGRVLLVSDPGIVAAGHVARALATLDDAGLNVIVYDAVRENPTTEDVDACLETAKDASIDLIIGLGGGSSLDTAKGCNFLLTNGGSIHDYRGVGKATKPMLPLIAIPTTAGTGSEFQSYALIADVVSHQKMACGDPKAAPAVAILDPTLTISQPDQVTKCTGIDAVSHAVETAVTRPRNPISAMFATTAFKLIEANFESVLAVPGELEVRSGMLLGAAYAGTAIENSMLGAAHSAANPLTAHYDLIHGQAVGMMLPCVVDYNRRDPTACRHYAELAVAAGLAAAVDSAESAAEKLADRLRCLTAAAGFPSSLAVCGVTDDAIPALAEEAANQWTAQFNPREIGTAEFEALYRKVM